MRGGGLGQGAQSGREMKREDNAETPRPVLGRLRAQRIAEKSRRRAGRAKKVELTTPDLVLLSLLAERPMHGYEANLERERREIRDWAGISRPQVYYSLEKLARAGLIRSSQTGERAAGPGRGAFQTPTKGNAARANAPGRDEGATQREGPACHTGIALFWH